LTNFFKIIDEDQNKNKIVNALEKTEVIFTIKSNMLIVYGKHRKRTRQSFEIKLQWMPTCSFAAVAMYSPQSQNSL
jgi:hypothetical protein